MSLPPGFLDELKSRLTISQVVGRKVTWDKKKSQPGKGDLWAPCPFHHEKTSSFHVVDPKGFYKCFGCQASGDAIKFVQETENVSFIEAVEMLATEAGMPMPAQDPKAKEKADRYQVLADVMEQAVKFYRLSLRTNAASAARAYLQRRGLSEATLERFEIGFAPEGWQNLWAHLTGKGIAPDLILEAGLAKPSDRGGAPYDAFRDRIMFPIRDGRGRCIAFGGRAMADGVGAKYLNSSETPLFDKGASLYNIGPARAAAGRGQPLIVAEGYMDVIALVEAGFEAAVAPLGTAITDRQVQMLWRMADEPILALDGDKAGVKAAFRVIDLSFPLLTSGKSLRFAMMPEGKDPDDLLRENGPAAVQEVLDSAKPMVSLLWQRETEGHNFDSPERRAMLDKSLRETLRQIKDASIRGHYGAEIKRLREQLFGYADTPATSFGAPDQGRPDYGNQGYGGPDYGGPDYGPDYGSDYRPDYGPSDYGQPDYAPSQPQARSFQPGGGRNTYPSKGGTFRPGGKGKGKWGQPPDPLPSDSLRASLSQTEALPLHASVILAVLATRVTLISDYIDLLERLDLPQPPLNHLRSALLTLPENADTDVAQTHISACGAMPALEAVLNSRQVRNTACFMFPKNSDYARQTLDRAAAELDAQKGLAAELQDAERDIAHREDEKLTWRLAQAARDRTQATLQMGEGNADTEVAENGVELDRDELERARRQRTIITGKTGGDDPSG